MRPELSIIITSYRNPGILELCINSLKENIVGVEYEIIVVDSATQEVTYDLMKEKFSTIKFIPNQQNTGFGFLVNTGIKVAQGKYLFIINSDIIIKTKESVFQLLDYLKNHPEVGIVGPRLINFDNSIQPSCFRFYTPLTIVYRRTFLKKYQFAKKHLDYFLTEDLVKKDEPVQADWIMGSAMLLSVDIQQQIGMMDTKRYFMYFEDVDWCWRIWELGYQVIHYPKVKVYHYHGKASAGQNAIKAVFYNNYTRIHIASAIKFFLKFWGKKNPHQAYLQDTKNLQKE